VRAQHQLERVTDAAHLGFVEGGLPVHGSEARGLQQRVPFAQGEIEDAAE
jgi:hypothetical protein